MLVYHSVFHIHINELSVCTKSIIHYNFVIHFSPLSRTFFEIQKLTLQFFTRWGCEQSHSVTHIQFTIPIHHVYKNTKSRCKIEDDKGLQWVYCIKKSNLWYLKSRQINMHLRKNVLFLNLFLFFGKEGAQKRML